MAWTGWQSVGLRPRPNRNKQEQAGARLRRVSQKLLAHSENGRPWANVRVTRTPSCGVSKQPSFPLSAHKFIDAVTAGDIREVMLAIERRTPRCCEASA